MTIFMGEGYTISSRLTSLTTIEKNCSKGEVKSLFRTDSEGYTIGTTLAADSTEI
jgi:hypothetical protein